MSMNSKITRVQVHFFLIIGVGILLATPALMNSFLTGHDFLFHIIFSQHFSEQFWQGEIYPRWMLNMNVGLGSPTFFFYAPIPYYITSLIIFLILGDISGCLPLVISATLALTASGITSYLWLRKLATDNMALSFSMLYMMLPYHFIVDFYIRFAFAELWAFVWMPLIFMFSYKTSEEGEANLIWLAIALSLLMMTHLPTLIIFMPVFISHFLFVNEKENRRKTVASHMIATVLAIGLAAVYWVPAMTTQEYVSMKSMFSGMFHYTNNFLLTGPIYGHSRSFWNYLSFITLFLSLVVFIVWFFGRTKTDVMFHKSINFWMVISWLSLFMTLPLSRFVWEIFPVVQKIQFPWRFNTILSFASVTLFALAFSNKHEIPLKINTHKLLVFLSLLLGVLLISEFVYGYNSMVNKRMNEKDVISYFLISRSPQEYRPYWVPEEQFYSDHIKAFAASIPKVTSDSNTQWEIKKWSPRLIILKTNATKNSVAVLHQFYYPGWVEKINSVSEAVPVTYTNQGVIQFMIPSGQHEITLTLQTLLEEKIGTVISALSLVVWFVLLLFMRKEKQK
ncbi:6-pyruvoyl-tetrahydropterin synthase-related protein [Tolumonas lignilytica]|uniref:6-pyruvoyl-tetrahydropterin synthase-related protein n=1 Tax=Tolumonas lignilytica TaxID=1283284 RepID=UPI00046326BC|nr:6-pyruvoyl-tetrahydropterin synthase-related protein [Tolumonas lignilytica]